MTDSLQTVPLRRIAHGRTGDKGDRSNISVICRHPAAYPFVEGAMTVARVKDLFAFRDVSDVRRYALPQLHAFNFVLDHALAGGVNRSLLLDRHGKGLSALLLDQPVQVPDWLLVQIAQ